jgi:hypothetical protein
MLLEIVGAALLLAGSALVLWIVVTADATVRPSHSHLSGETDIPILKRAA